MPPSTLPFGVVLEPEPAPEPTPPDPSKPDVIIFDSFDKTIATLPERVDAICAIASGIMNLAAGAKPCVRPINQGHVLVTQTANDLLMFPVGHSRAGQPRYRWQPGPNGTTLGFKVEGA